MIAEVFERYPQVGLPIVKGAKGTDTFKNEVALGLPAKEPVENFVGDARDSFTTVHTPGGGAGTGAAADRHTGCQSAGNMQRSAGGYFPPGVPARGKWRGHGKITDPPKKCCTSVMVGGYNGIVPGKNRVRLIEAIERMYISMTNEEMKALYESLNSVEYAYALMKENGDTGTMDMPAQ